ncbi:MAG: EI24 domain-containing protein [Deltaproteobacteria bacterium]|nr:EI24 domain-containing protein [Nannocystaceae bacterium]
MEPRPTTDRYEAPRGGTAPHRSVPRSPFDVRAAWQRLQWFADPSLPLPPASVPRARVLYGLAQPLLGMRVLLRDRGLLGDALAPVVFVALVCLTIAAAITEDLEQGGATTELLGDLVLPWWLAFVISFFATFASVAPVPPLLFARHHARLAARARVLLGHSEQLPYLKGLRQSATETVVQTIVIALGIFPITLVLALVPMFGPLCAFVLQMAWTTHWMVVEALDSGRTLAPGDDADDALVRERAERFTPWFVRVVAAVQRSPWHKLLTPVRMVNEVTETLVRDWGPELRIVERERALCSGFGIGVLVVLAIPGINLLFRPALVVAATHLRAQLEREHAELETLASLEGEPAGAASLAAGPAGAPHAALHHRV